jgi:ABC-type lipoprotein release transport system permease subunit
MKSVFDFTLRSLGRFGKKNLLIFLIFTLLVALLGSAFMITNALKIAFLSSAKWMPEIVITDSKGGQLSFIQSQDLDPIWLLPGVDEIKGRLWGRYYLEMDRLHVSIIGADSFDKLYAPSLQKITNQIDSDDANMFVSQNLKKLLKPYMSGNMMPFLAYDGGFVHLKLAGILPGEDDIRGNDIIVMPIEQARKILGIESGFTDAIVRVKNPEEIITIATKIKNINPHWLVTTKEEIIQRYLGLYDYKSGWFLALLIVSFITFAMILYDKASGLSAQERREIGLLKALGWETSHIIAHKITEAAIISIGGFIVGFNIALGYVFIFNAPLLRRIFTGYESLQSAFELPFTIDFSTFMLLFFATVPLYLAASVIPAWRAGILEAGEVMR